MGSTQSAGPNECLILTGGGCDSGTTRRYLINESAWSWWCLSNAQKISLEPLSVALSCERVKTKDVESFIQASTEAQCKITINYEDPVALEMACEQFCGRAREQIQRALGLTLEGRLDELLGCLTSQEIDNIDQLKSLFRQKSERDLARMGMVLMDIDFVQLIIHAPHEADRNFIVSNGLNKNGEVVQLDSLSAVDDAGALLVTNQV